MTDYADRQEPETERAPDAAQPAGVPAGELPGRRERLAAALEAEGIDLLLVSSRVNLYYWTGTSQEGQWLFRPGRDPVLAVRKDQERAASDLPPGTPDRLEPLRSFRDLPRLAETLLEGQAPIRLGLELDQLPAGTYLRLMSLFPGSEAVNLSPLLRSLRMVKSDWEIEQSRAAARILHAAAVEGFRLLREGLTESGLAAHLTAVILRRGAQALVRVHRAGNELPHVLLSAGADSAVATYFPGVCTGRGRTPAVPLGPGLRRIAPGEPVICDMAIGYNGYVADQTRLYWLDRLPPRLAEAYGVACRIQERLAATARPGMPAGELFREAEAIADQAGLIDHFMGYRENRLPFVGHGIGLELDELPVLARGVETPLEPGMLIAVEPKFIFPGVGSAGNEDSYVVTEEGLQPITRAPRRLVPAGA